MNDQTRPVTATTRRRFLQIVAVAGTAGIALKLGLDARARAQAVSRTRLLMGTIVNLTVIGDDREEAEAAVDATLDRMADLERRLSRHRPDSEVGTLNRTGRLDDAGDDLLAVLALAHEISALGEGAFDITVQPVSDLYAAAPDEHAAPPSAEDTERALELVSYRAIEIEGRGVRFTRPGMAMTLDGIGKGYVVDRGVEVLKKRGFGNVLVEAGGDLYASGVKANDMPWTIGIRSPRPESAHPLVSFPAGDFAVATSGDYMQPYSDDRTRHHILDPRTGVSAPEPASSTVIAPSVAMADGLATLTMVLGPKRSVDLLESREGCEGYFIGKDLSVTRTPGFPIAS